jgi:REP element-mobilizing transposase RayT
MGRPLRHDTEGAWYHLMNRGADRQDIFSSDDDRIVAEQHLGELVARNLLQIHAYAFMDNHFHLVVRSPCGELSTAMHRFGSEYARWYNRRHHRDGPLFRNRFISVPITSDEQFLTASRYVHRNPLAMVPPVALASYRWSSLGAYLERRNAPDWLERSIVASALPDGARHLEFVLAPHESDADHERWAPFRISVELDALEDALATLTGADPTSTATSHRRRSDAFVLLVTLAVELRITSAEHLATRYGLPSTAAVRTIARRGRVRLVDETHLAHLRAATLASIGRRRAA